MQLHPPLYICILVLAVLLEGCDSNKKTDLIKAQEEGDPILTAKVDYLNSLLDSIESSLREKNYAEAERVSLELTKVIAEIGIENEGMLQQSLLESLGQTSSEIVLEENNSEIIDKSEKNDLTSDQISEDHANADDEDVTNKAYENNKDELGLDNSDNNIISIDSQIASLNSEKNESERLDEANVTENPPEKKNSGNGLLDKEINIPHDKENSEDRNDHPLKRLEAHSVQSIQNYRLDVRVFPKIKNESKDRYYGDEKISLNIKIENRDLNNPCKNIRVKYYLIGRELKNKKEYILIGSGEEEIDLGSTFSDRKEEIDTSLHTNKYYRYTSSRSFKYDSWVVAVVTRDGKIISYETHSSIKWDYDKVNLMESRKVYDQSLSPISGIYRSSSGGVFYNQ